MVFNVSKRLSLHCVQLTAGRGGFLPPQVWFAMKAVVPRRVSSPPCGQCRRPHDMASKMFGVDPDQSGQEMRDAFSEVCDMVARNSKNKVSGLAEGCMLSVPTVVTGSDYSVHSLSDAAALSLNVLFEGMPVFVVLEIHG